MLLLPLQAYNYWSSSASKSSAPHYSKLTVEIQPFHLQQHTHSGNISRAQKIF